MRFSNRICIINFLNSRRVKLKKKKIKSQNTLFISLNLGSTIKLKINFSVISLTYHFNQKNAALEYQNDSRINCVNNSPLQMS